MSRLILILLVIEVGLPLLLYLGRNRLIFFPSKHPSPEAGLDLLNGMANVDLVQIPRPDGRSLAAYDIRPPTASADGPVVIFFHGNAGNIGYRAQIGESFAVGTGARTLLFDYSGYGGNKGSPSEEEIYRDGLAAVDYLLELGVAPQRLVLYGESLGGAVAIYVAAHRDCGGLVVQSTFSSMSSLVLRLYRWLPLSGLLARGCFPNTSRIAKLQIPILVVHGNRDEVIPFEEGQKLHAAAPKGSDFLTIEGAGHNDLLDTAGESYLAKLRELFALWVQSSSKDTCLETLLRGDLLACASPRTRNADRDHEPDKSGLG